MSEVERGAAQLLQNMEVGMEGAFQAARLPDGSSGLRLQGASDRHRRPLAIQYDKNLSIDAVRDNAKRQEIHEDTSGMQLRMLVEEKYFGDIAIETNPTASQWASKIIAWKVGTELAVMACDADLRPKWLFQKVQDFVQNQKRVGRRARSVKEIRQALTEASASEF